MLYRHPSRCRYEHIRWEVSDIQALRRGVFVPKPGALNNCGDLSARRCGVCDSADAAFASATADAAASSLFCRPRVALCLLTSIQQSATASPRLASPVTAADHRNAAPMHRRTLHFFVVVRKVDISHWRAGKFPVADNENLQLRGNRKLQKLSGGMLADRCLTAIPPQSSRQNGNVSRIRVARDRARSAGGRTSPVSGIVWFSRSWCSRHDSRAHGLTALVGRRRLGSRVFPTE